MCIMNWNSLRESYTHLTSWENTQYIYTPKFLVQKLCLLYCHVYVCKKLLVISWRKWKLSIQMLDTCSLSSQWTCVREGLCIWFSFLRNRRKTLAKALIEVPSSDEFDDLHSNRQNIFRVITRGFGTSTYMYRKQWVLSKWGAFFFFKEEDPEKAL